MTRQKNGMPELKYSEETFRDMYEALKEICSVMSTQCSVAYLYKHNLTLPLSKGHNALGKLANQIVTDPEKLDQFSKKWTKREQQEYSEILPKVECLNCGYKFILLHSSKKCPLCGNER